MTDSHSRASAGGAEAPRRPAALTNRWVALAIVFVTRTTMGYQFQAIASVGPLIVTDLGLSWAQLGSLIGLYMLPGAFLARRPSGRRATWTTAAVSPLGLLLIAFAYRHRPRRKEGAAARAKEGARLSGREIALGATGGFAWGWFNASLVAVIAFGPGL